MEPDAGSEREIRAARNQSLFREVNEKMCELHKAFAAFTGTLTIACECANVECVQQLEIDPLEYLSIRSEPRHFAVRSGHVYPEVERVVRERGSYVVVEKEGAAGELAEELVPQRTPA